MGEALRLPLFFWKLCVILMIVREGRARAGLPASGRSLIAAVAINRSRTSKGVESLNQFHFELQGLVGCLIAWVILFSPIGLKLSFSSSSILVGGLSLALSILLLGATVYFLVRLYKKLGKADLLPKKPAGPEIGGNVRNRLSAMKQRPGSGYIAEQALKQLDAAQQKTTNFREVIRSRFGEGSLTSGRYEGVLEQGMEVIEKNAERISEQLMLFDDDAYEKLSKSIASGAYKKDGVSDSIQEERLMSERKRLKGMEAIMDSNEEILLLLDKCAGEVAGLSNGEDEARNEQILEEIRKLIETTKYYQSKT